MAFPPSFIERLRTHLPISQVIGKRIPVKKHGREHQALCPFHKEKSPSFTINDDKGFYHCFGCGAHGDSIEFIRRHEHTSYREAVEKLARESGIPLPELTPQMHEKIAREKTLYDAVEEATKWFEHQLALASGVRARDYLMERGIRAETIQHFRLGLAPDGRDSMKKHLLAQNFTEAQLVEAGLVIQIESGISYDRFRNRLMFPIRDTSGRVIAFGGRLIGAPRSHSSDERSAAPKYLNSPETPLFKKGDTLYNFDTARKSAREKDEMIIVEGYMDVIALWQAGIPQSVATLGTAVTAEHLQRIWQVIKEPILCLDGDEAGRRAMIRAAELSLPLLKPGVSLRFATLPPGEDPDSLVRQQGVQGVTQCLHASKRLSDTLWDIFSASVRVHTPEARAGLEQKLMALANRIEDSVMRSHYRSFFKRKLWPANMSLKLVAANQPERSTHVEQLATRAQEHPLKPFAKQLVTMVLLQPVLLQKAEIEEAFSQMDCRDHDLAELRQTILDITSHADVLTHESLLARLVEMGRGDQVALLLGGNMRFAVKSYAHSSEETERAWREVMASYHLAGMEMEYKHIQQLMEQHTTDELLTRFVELQQQLREVQQSRRFSLLSEQNA